MRGINRKEPPTALPAYQLPWYRKLVLRLFRVRVRYTSKLVRAVYEGSRIIRCNHLSFMDGIIVAFASPVPLVCAVNKHHAEDSFMTSFLLKNLSRLGLGEVVPLDTDNPNGIRRMVRAIEHGKSVLIFPAGGFNESGELPEMPGLDWMIKYTGAKVERIRLRGADRSKLFSYGDHLWPRVWLRF